MSKVLCQILFQKLSSETNNYAATKQQNWEPVTPEEMQAYLGLRVYMSVISLPNLAMYWSNESIFCNQFVHNIMTQERFVKISEYFHAADPSSKLPKRRQNQDRLAHVRHVLEAVRTKCRENYRPHQNVSINQASLDSGELPLWRRCTSVEAAKQIQVWMWAQPKNGYCSDFRVLIGKKSNKAAAVIQDLMSPVQGRNHIVNCGGDFCSADLCERLLQGGVYTRGRVRADDPDFPTVLLNNKHLTKPGDLVGAQRGDLLALRWWGKNFSLDFFTTADQANSMVELAQQGRDSSQCTTKAPRVFGELKRNANGVTLADRMRLKYPTYRKSPIFWHYLFWFLFDICVTNGYILMKGSPFHQQSKARSHLSFRKNLAKQLIGEYRCTTKRLCVTYMDPATTGHWPEKIAMSKHCRECQLCGRKKRVSSLRCEACNVHLCLSCFKPYHKRLAYS